MNGLQSFGLQSGCRENEPELSSSGSDKDETLSSDSDKDESDDKDAEKMIPSYREAERELLAAVESPTMGTQLQSFYGGRCGSSRSGGSRKAASRASPITTSISSTTTT